MQTAAMGTKEEVYFRGCETLGVPVQKTKDAHGFGYRPQENAILQPGGNAGKTNKTDLLVYPKATGLHVLRFLFPGLHAAGERAAEPDRQALH
ncbi:hypothetical protein [Fodinicola feengrottensis]|uniref:hypothetical protein n=1 Tax=Fodinicola feengrottensis TaxID=435914 RepID=UPI0024412145|nr:hypothetical protein [Fodinicola feengrottensis]